MEDMELTVSYREGRPYAAYLTFSHPRRMRSHHQREMEADIIVDFDRKGSPLGIEILFPGRGTWTRLNRVMKRLELEPLGRQWARPLRAA